MEDTYGETLINICSMEWLCKLCMRQHLLKRLVLNNQQLCSIWGSPVVECNTGAQEVRGLNSVIVQTYLADSESSLQSLAGIISAPSGVRTQEPKPSVSS